MARTAAKPKVKKTTGGNPNGKTRKSKAPAAKKTVKKTPKAKAAAKPKVKKTKGGMPSGKTRKSKA